MTKRKIDYFLNEVFGRKSDMVQILENLIDACYSSPELSTKADGLISDIAFLSK